MKFIVLITLYVVLNSFGQILIKLGTSDVKTLNLLSFLSNIKLLFGLILFGLSFLTWIIILSKSNLSYSFPFVVGLGYAAVILLSYIILKEPMGSLQLIGVIAVGIGLVIIAISK